MTLPSSSRERRTALLCFSACSRGSSFRRGPSSSAGQAGCGQAPGFAISHRPRERWHGRVDRHRADDITLLVDELWIAGELELLHPMRLRAMNAPDALDGTGTNADCFRHQGGSPVGCHGGRIDLGERHEALGDA
jgi:hypothetical protein